MGSVRLRASSFVCDGVSSRWLGHQILALATGVRCPPPQYRNTEYRSGPGWRGGRFIPGLQGVRFSSLRLCSCTSCRTGPGGGARAWYARDGRFESGVRLFLFLLHAGAQCCLVDSQARFNAGWSSFVAGVSSMVRTQPSKLMTAGSIPVTRSIFMDLLRSANWSSALAFTQVIAGSTPVRSTLLRWTPIGLGAVF